MESILTTSGTRSITLIGAGLAGALLATLLARRGWQVHVYEKRGDPRLKGYEGRRSINQALAAESSATDQGFYLPEELKAPETVWMGWPVGDNKTGKY